MEYKIIAAGGGGQVRLQPGDTQHRVVAASNMVGAAHTAGI